MRGKIILCLFMVLIWGFPAAYAADRTAPARLSVFNFGTLNLEASGYGTTVTNLLTTALASEPSLNLLGRRELESFLSLNDLQQNDVLDNVVAIGSRLNLDVIVVGTVEKRSGVISVNAKVVHIPQKKVILNTQVKALGDGGLPAEIKNLSAMIILTVAAQAGRQWSEEATDIKGPVNIKKRAGSKRIQLTWEDPAGSAAAGYEVVRGTSDKGPFIKMASVNQPEYVDQDLESNITYYYKIRSFNSKGLMSEYSALIAAQTALSPNPPVILRAEGHIKSIHVIWSPSPMISQDPSRIKGFKFHRAKTEQGPYKEVADVFATVLGIRPDASSTDKMTQAVFQDRGLDDGQECYYRITAYNENNIESEFSLPIKGAAIPAVLGLTAQGEMIREIRLTWNAVPSPAVRGYAIYRSPSEGGNFTRIHKIDAGSGGKVQFTDKEGLGDAHRYFYRVAAYEGDVETSPSPVAQAVTKGKPPVPEGLKAVSGLVKKVDLSWKGSPLAEVEGYNLYRASEKTGKYALIKRIEGRNNSTFTDGEGGLFGSISSSLADSLEDNKTYYYVIKSYNKVELESEISEVVEARTKARPAKPAGLKAEPLKVKSVPLAWTANPEKDIRGYHIYRASGPAGAAESFASIARVDKTGYVDGNLKDGQTYLYRLQAEDKDALLSDFSDTITVQTKPKPRPPGGLKGDVADGKVRLSWTPGQEADIASYAVYAKTFFSLQKIGAVSEAVFIENSPPAGKTKTYVVVAVDRDGLESDGSPELIVTGK